MIALALSMGWAMTASGRFGNLIRRAVVPRLHFIPGMRTRTLHSRTPALRPSALVMKSLWPSALRASAHRWPWGLAGTLCPNPVLRDGRRVDTALGNGFALITTQPLSARQSDQLRQRGAIHLPAEPGSDLARWLRRGGAHAAIVRPDRTVMRAERNVDVLCRSMPSFRVPIDANASARKRASKR